MIWQYSKKILAKNVLVEFLVGKIIPDQDGDGVDDILVAQTSRRRKY